MTVCEVCRRSTGDVRKYHYRDSDGGRIRVHAHEGCWEIYKQKNGLHDPVITTKESEINS